MSTLTVCTILFLSLLKALFDFSNSFLIFLIVFFPWALSLLFVILDFSFAFSPSILL